MRSNFGCLVVYEPVWEPANVCVYVDEVVKLSEVDGDDGGPGAFFEVVEPVFEVSDADERGM